MVEESNNQSSGQHHPEQSADDNAGPEQQHNSLYMNLLGEMDEARSSDEDCSRTFDTNERAMSEYQMYTMKAKEELMIWKANCNDKPYNALGFWQKYQSQFPLLVPIARKWLCAVATSVPSERCFSTSGNTVTKKRASLSSGLVRDILFVHDNYDALHCTNKLLGCYWLLLLIVNKQPDVHRGCLLTDVQQVGGNSSNNNRTEPSMLTIYQYCLARDDDVEL